MKNLIGMVAKDRSVIEMSFGFVTCPSFGQYNYLSTFFFFSPLTLIVFLHTTSVLDKIMYPLTTSDGAVNLRHRVNLRID